MAKDQTPVDFNNPEELAAAVAASETTAPKAPKAPKEKKPRVIKVKYTAPADIAAGQTIEFDYELPLSVGTRGAVSGIALPDMTDDQLKIEYRNANSVFYKTTKAGHDASKAEARLNACKAEMEKRGIQPTARAAAPVTVDVIAELIKSGKISVEELQAKLG